MTATEITEKYSLLFPKDGNGYPPDIFVDAGWLPIVANLSGALQFFIETTIFRIVQKGGNVLSVHAPQVFFQEIKEKFGTARFYISYHPWPDDVQANARDGEIAQATEDYSAQIDGIILFAEYLCCTTCEKCGQPGRLCVANHWFSTLCPTCAAKGGFVPHKGVLPFRSFRGRII